ncbi:ABC transporter substrate-binding protein [Paenibacillus solisilvae]|uniref:ABC transporter substrate-binding protein n=1 Tax=Paenibacillus solisilvae TaxID=2486751 RepID=A0ABW0VTM6_9BACL
MKKFIGITLLSIMAIAAISGCTNEAANTPSGSVKEESSDKQDNVKKDSVEESGNANEESAETNDNELFIYTGDQLFNKRYVDEDNFEMLIGQFIKKKFPNIVVKHVQWDDGNRYEDLVAKQTFPDIILEDVRRNTHRYVERYNLQYDMSELIKKHNFDTGKLDPAFLQMSKNASDGKLYSLPFEGSEYLLYYNKDIFDKFGVDYPKPGMTYDQIYELAKKLTRQEGDITYKGYQQHPEYYMMLNQLSEPALDPVEDKASLLSDKWSKIVNNLRRFYDIPGNQFTTVKDFPKGQIAMAVDVEQGIVDYATNYKDLNFDIAPVPVFPEASHSKYQPYSYGAFITNQSKNKDLAFEVLAYLLSEEIQIERSKMGISSPLKSDAVRAAYLQGVPQMEGKQLQSFFALDSAMPAPRKPGLTFIDPKVRNVFNPLIFEESKDTQTALRVTNEEMNKAIDETSAVQKGGGVSPHL